MCKTEGVRERVKESENEKRKIRQVSYSYSRLARQHINLQVHLIVGKLNAALSED